MNDFGAFYFILEYTGVLLDLVRLYLRDEVLERAGSAPAAAD